MPSLAAAEAGQSDGRRYQIETKYGIRSANLGAAQPMRPSSPPHAPRYAGFPSPNSSSRSGPFSTLRAWSRRLFMPLKNCRYITTVR